MTIANYEFTGEGMQRVFENEMCIRDRGVTDEIYYFIICVFPQIKPYFLPWLHIILAPVRTAGKTTQEFPLCRDRALCPFCQRLCTVHNPQAHILCHRCRQGTPRTGSFPFSPGSQSTAVLHRRNASLFLQSLCHPRTTCRSLPQSVWTGAPDRYPEGAAYQKGNG